jgi:hypothetical protein
VRLEIPPAFAADVADRNDGAGRAWLRRLPDQVAGLHDDWQLVPEGTRWWGYCEIALPVRRADDGSTRGRAADRLPSGCP